MRRQSCSWVVSGCVGDRCHSTQLTIRSDSTRELTASDTPQTVSEHWTTLGRYRISSTRGGGFLNVFFADGCRPSDTRRASDDMEKQVSWGFGLGWADGSLSIHT